VRNVGCVCRAVTFTNGSGFLTERNWNLYRDQINFSRDQVTFSKDKITFSNFWQAETLNLAEVAEPLAPWFDSKIVTSICKVQDS
jgi:hypothetical protein